MQKCEMESQGTCPNEFDTPTHATTLLRNRVQRIMIEIQREPFRKRSGIHANFIKDFHHPDKSFRTIDPRRQYKITSFVLCQESWSNYSRTGVRGVIKIPINKAE